MAFKTFTAGETLTASDVNTYLAKQAVIVCTSGTRPGSPVEGMVIYETDTDKLLSYDGATWNLPKNVAGGTLGYAEVTASQTGITTEVDITGLSVTVTVGASRRICVTAQVRASSSVADDGIEVNIKEGATRLNSLPHSVAAASRPDVISGSAVITPSAGSHTYKATVLRFAGTGTVAVDATATSAAFLVVEDIGAA